MTFQNQLIVVIPLVSGWRAHVMYYNPIFCSCFLKHLLPT